MFYRDVTPSQCILPTRALRVTTPLALAFLTACAAEPEAQGTDATTASVGAAETAAQPRDEQMLSLLEGRIEIAQDKFLQLAEAVPEDRYD